MSSHSFSYIVPNAPFPKVELFEKFNSSYVKHQIFELHGKDFIIGWYFSTIHLNDFLVFNIQ